MPALYPRQDASQTQWPASLILVLFLLTTTAFPQPRWRLAAGTAGIRVAAIDIYRSNPDTMYALGEVFLRSTNNGGSWDTIPTGPTRTAGFGALRVDPYNSRLIYASHFGIDANDVSMTTDGGLTWRRLFIGTVLYADVVELSPRDHRTVYVGVGPGDLWRSTNQGADWTRLAEGPIVAVTSLAINTVNDSILYASHLYGIVLKSTDWGATWQQLNLGIQANGGTRLAIDPTDPRILYVTVYSSGATPGGVFKTTDAGASWREMNNGLDPENRGLSAIAINTANPLELFIGGNFPTMVFRTTNGGEQWLPFNNGLPTASGHAERIEIDTLNAKVFVCIVSSSASGVYVYESITSSDISDKVTPTSPLLHQNYPNPFNASTVISYEIPRRSHVSLSVYDVLGREVSKLIDEMKEAGSYRVTWQAEKVSSGIYFAVMKSDLYTLIRKMILLR